MALLSSGGTAHAQISPCPFNIDATQPDGSIGDTVGTFDSRTLSADRRSGVVLWFEDSSPNALPPGVDLVDYCFPNGLPAGVPINEPWIHFDTGNYAGDGIFTILLDFDANTTSSARTGTVSIGNATVQYTQASPMCSAASIALSGHSFFFPGDVTTITAFTTTPTDPSCFTGSPPAPAAAAWISVLDWSSSPVWATSESTPTRPARRSGGFSSLTQR